MGGAIASSQADSIWWAVLYLSQMASAVWEMIQNRDPGSCSFRSLPRDTAPSPPSTGSPQVSLFQSALPMLVATNKIFCVGPLRGSLILQPSHLGRQKCCCFSQLDVIWVPFQLWCCRLRSPAWILDPTLLRGNPPATEISLWHFSCHPWGPSQSCHVSSTLPTYLVVVKWFLLSVPGFKASLQLLLFRMISVQFICNSRLVLGGS